MSSGIWTWVGQRKHKSTYNMGVITGGTWQKPLNRPCAAVMRPSIKLF